MQKIPLDLAKPGMVLDKPILRNNGQILVAQGTEISESLIGRLENMGISSVTVQGNPVEMEGVTPPKTYQQRIDELDHLFRRYDDDKWMSKMKRFIRSYFKRKIAAQEAASKAAAQSPKQNNDTSEKE
ncbi:MAG: hypothetical protein D5R98_08745 [Desulfonatronovibrio sp. MSAO_Bac4]|nr:MAG: hypothetical protein D5R98_08745 [Desulfonatronovibrio sp. MSAO_Bac4]